MIENIFAVIAVAAVSAAVVALYYRICHPAKFWAVMAAWFFAGYEHANREKAVCRYRESLRPVAPRKPRQTATVIDNGRQYQVEERA